MPYRRTRVGYALVLLAIALVPSAGPRDSAVSASPAAVAASTQPSAADSSSSAQIVLIPCVSGMCQLPLHGTPALEPLKPGPPAPVSTSPSPYALADADFQP